MRGGVRQSLALELPKDWRRAGDFGWRYRVAGYAMWMWSGVTFVDSPRGPRVAHRSPGWFKKTNSQAYKLFHPGDVILEVDGQKDWDRSLYIAYLMRQKKPGATVRLVVLRDGKEVKLSFEVPKPRPAVLGG